MVAVNEEIAVDLLKLLRDCKRLHTDKCLSESLYFPGRCDCGSEKLNARISAMELRVAELVNVDLPAFWNLHN